MTLRSVPTDPDTARFALRCIAGGAVLMVVGVMLGAFGSHVLQETLTPRRFASFQTGVNYHFLHAIGLILVGAVGLVTEPSRWLQRAAALMILGIGLFAGSIYLMTLGAPRWLGMIAPVGGVSFMLAWAALALHARNGTGERGP